MNKTIFSFFIYLSLVLVACNNPTNTIKKELDKTPTDKDTSLTPSTSTLQKELDILEGRQGNSNRTIWQQPRMIIQRLGNLEEKVVADIGAGPHGYFSFQLAGEAKKVLAIDINKGHLDFMDSLKTEILPSNKQEVLEVRLASANNPNLKSKEADVIFLMNIYAYLPSPPTYLQTLKKGLADNGKVLIVDFKMRQLPLGPSKENKVPLYQIEQDLGKAGFQIESVDDCSLDYQYMLIASKV